jgi:hypothetical protein
VSKNSSHFAVTQLELAALLKGLQGMPAGSSLILSGVNRQRDDLIQTTETHLTRYTDADEAHVVASQKVKVRDDGHPAARDFVTEMHAALQVQLGPNNTALLDYGVSPRKARRKLTPEEKKAATDKARQTRERNHTMGRKQKKALQQQEEGKTPPPTKA